MLPLKIYPSPVFLALVLSWMAAASTAPMVFVNTISLAARASPQTLERYVRLCMPWLASATSAQQIRLFITRWLSMLAAVSITNFSSRIFPGACRATTCTPITPATTKTITAPPPELSGDSSSGTPSDLKPARKPLSASNNFLHPCGLGTQKEGCDAQVGLPGFDG